MNLHAIAGPIIAAVNPFTAATVKISTGYTTAADGSRAPTYDDYFGVPIQVQAMTGKDLRQIEGLNLQGTLRSIYVSGKVSGQIRVSNKGGDLIQLADCPNAGTWLVNQVLEQWPDWCKVVATLQDGN